MAAGNWYPAGGRIVGAVAGRRRGWFGLDLPGQSPKFAFAAAVRRTGLLSNLAYG